MVNVLVTGANGFVGRHLVEIAQCDPRINVYKGLRTSSAAVAEDERVLGDLAVNPLDSGQLSAIDVLVHLAARVHVMHENSEKPLEAFRQVNLEGTRALLVAAKAASVKRFVYVSSIKVNGERTAEGKPFNEQSLTHPQDAYAVSKYEAEILVKSFCEGQGIEWVIVRPPLIYGAGVAGNFAKIVNALVKKLPLPISSFSNKRSMIAVENFANFLIECSVNQKAANELFLVSDGQDLSVAQLINYLKKVNKSKSFLFPLNRKIFLLLCAAIGRKEMARRLCDELTVDISKAKTLLGWTPPLTALQALNKMKNNND